MLLQAAACISRPQAWEQAGGQAGGPIAQSGAVSSHGVVVLSSAGQWLARLLQHGLPARHRWAQPASEAFSHPLGGMQPT